ncbi:unnamed protein product [Acanthoscelides obtectus]|uniref:PiggyBac transposable element-derived protein domain-containing protein n=1 Tax=Acanthoscelides obtectus TaxID=200917 RepID=A0A9P0MB25_ACAOB|nr:unnamed protein product [Acanthoscelides obtectus]CAK1623145.1 hypothetical protein AOBTE_LOCUS1829 [Acanthoscelides obtectus]
MSKRTRPLSQSELLKIADNFGKFSDEDDSDPFEASESDYVCSSESDSSSTSDSESIRIIQQYVSRKKVKLNPNPSTVQPNIDPEAEIGEEPCEVSEANVDPAYNLDPEENTDLDLNDRNPQRNLNMPSLSNWGQLAGNYKKIPDFTIESGIKSEVAALLAHGKPGDFFDAVVDNRVISMICDQTNLYASQTLMRTDAKPSSRLHEWIPTTNTEIRKILGLVAWMGLVQMPKICRLLEQ